jgi:radical SAM protein with 4Fe4S-binding SPASM domain
VHSWGLLNNADKKLETQEFAVHEAEWFDLMIHHGFTPSLLPGKKNTVCRAASTNRVVIGHDGEIHKCTETPLTPFNAKYDLQEMKQQLTSTISSNRLHDRLGKVGDIPLLQNGTEWKWLDALKRGTYPCTECVFLPCCGGACPLSWMNGATPCPSYKFNMPSRLRLFPALSSIEGSPSLSCNITAKQEFSPMWLLARFRDVDKGHLEAFDNFLASSRRQASLGYQATAKRQHQNAVFTMPRLGLRPVVIHLGSAAELASRAYLAYKDVTDESASYLLMSAIGALKAAHRCDKGLDTIPAEIQLLINIVRVEGDSAGELQSRIRDFLENNAPLHFEGMSFEANSDGLKSARTLLLQSLDNCTSIPKMAT